MPARAFTAVGTAMSKELASTQPFRVQVRRRDLDHAHNLLAQIRRDHAELDWDQIDVGEPEDAAPVPAITPAPAAVVARAGPDAVTVLGVLALLFIALGLIAALVLAKP